MLMPNELMSSPLTTPGHTDCAFHRGFLARVRCSWADWSRYGDTILADPWVPGLDEVELTTPRPVVSVGGGMVSIPGIAGWTSMTGKDPVARLLNARWRYDNKPAVRKWTLPPEPRVGEGSWGELRPVVDPRATASPGIRTSG
jgi:hypothetical protein